MPGVFLKRKYISLRNTSLLFAGRSAFACVILMILLLQGTRLAIAAADNSSKYLVEGMALGTRLSLGSTAYQAYKCVPSQQFPGFTWCTKKRSGREPRGNFEASYSLLHASNGAVVYVNRFQAPAYWGRTEVDDDIQRYSKKLGAQPIINNMPVRPGLPRGTLATWGNVHLEVLDSGSLKQLSEGKSIRKGILVDYLGDFSRSAREGLPVYRITGGAGFLWVASYDQNGRGTLRFAVVDASAYSRSEAPNPESEPSNPDANVTAQTLESSQKLRNELFNVLRASNTQYAFDYIVINKFATRSFARHRCFCPGHAPAL